MKLKIYHKIPLFRWTIGPCISQGFDILRESVKSTTNVYGKEFKWVICHNNLNRRQLKIVKELSKEYNVTLHKQSWDNCPLPIKFQTLEKEDGKFPIGGKKCNGSIWKLCPARLKLDTHEIIADNDLIIADRIEKLDKFLYTFNCALMTMDRFRYYGSYDKFISDNILGNTGLLGFPPYYDFEKRILKTWKKYGSIKSLTQADEQGLVTATLLNDFKVVQNTNIIKYQIFGVDTILQVLAEDTYKISQSGSYVSNSYGGRLRKESEESIFRANKYSNGFHFCQANKIDNHIGWKFYKEYLMKE